VDGVNLELANTSNDPFNPISELCLLSHPRFDRTTVPTHCRILTDSKVFGDLSQRPIATPLHQVQRHFPRFVLPSPHPAKDLLPRYFVLAHDFDADEYLAAVVRYIHLNAVEAGWVKMPEDYLWASHRYYVQAKGAPGWLDTAPAMEQLGGRQAFHEFVLSGNEESLTQYYESKHQSPILGSETFIEAMARATRSRSVPVRGASSSPPAATATATPPAARSSASAPPASHFVRRLSRFIGSSRVGFAVVMRPACPTAHERTMSGR